MFANFANCRFEGLAFSGLNVGGNHTVTYSANTVTANHYAAHVSCPACGGRCSGTPNHRCVACGAQVCPAEAP